MSSDADEQRPARFRARAMSGRTVAREHGPVVELRGANPFRVLGKALTGIFTMLRTLFAPGPRMPVYLQMQASDCGPVCLAMVLAHHGIEPDLARLRAETDVGIGGVSARVLLDTARRYGLAGRGVRTSVAGLANLSAGTILFWNFEHYVVFEKLTHEHLHVVDPAFGRRQVARAVAEESFTGVAVEFSAPLGDQGTTKRPFRKRFTESNWRYLTLFFPRTLLWVPLIGASLVLMLATLVVPLATAVVVDRVTAHEPLPNVPLVLIIIGVLLAAFCLLQLARSLAIVVVQALGDKQVTLGLLHHLLSLPFDYLTQRTPGDLAQRIRTTTVVRQVLTNSAMSTICDGVLILVYASLLMLADLTLTLLVLGLAVLQVLLLLAGWGRQQSLATDALESQTRAQGQLVELLQSLPTLKAGGLDAVAGNRWSHALAEEVNGRTRARRDLAVWSGMSLTIQFGAPLVVLLVGTLHVESGAMSLGEALAFTSLTLGLFVPLANLVQAGLQVSGLGPHLARMRDVLEAEPENAPGLAVLDRVHGRVEVRSGQFRYLGGRTPVLDKIDLAIAPGEFVIVLGASGSGKSTLATLLAGLQLPTAGEILVDGTPVTSLDRAALRSMISYVNQDTRIFAGTIIDNIRWGRPAATPDQVRAAAALAAIDTEIEALPLAYDTMLGPGGIGLSGGQRQRIALARALVREPHLIVLDEATSALNVTLEKQIFTNLVALGRTLVVIAHRLTGLAEADQILIMEDGRIVHRGRYHELTGEIGELLGLDSLIAPPATR
ncbi:peptidase domain-containing ABC transporter [Nonomuraea fuscirosea]|uniref:peptidase domain-containing ABC transporter n=1 Tax=Nonomuraea fuscirosea TaxID=1291556 RepID=UPI00343693F4